MFIFKNNFMWILACCGAPALGGCGPAAVDDLPREAVSGRVTLDGAPLARGTIAFSPTAESPTPGMVSIYDGRYSMPQAYGLVPGPYKVSIESLEGAVPVEEPGEVPGKAARKQADAADARYQESVRSGKAALPPNRIPARYNTATTLVVEVKGGASNSFNFDLSSAAAPKK